MEVDGAFTDHVVLIRRIDFDLGLVPAMSATSSLPARAIDREEGLHVLSSDERERNDFKGLSLDPSGQRMF